MSYLKEKGEGEEAEGPEQGRNANESKGRKPEWLAFRTQRNSTPLHVPARMPVMRTVLGKTLQILGAVACLFALVLGLGLTPSGHGHVLWELVLLAAGVTFLLGGTLMESKKEDVGGRKDQRGLRD